MSESQSGTDEAALWALLLQQQDQNARASLIEIHTGLARKIAASIYSKGYKDYVEFDDFFQLGLVGLIESVDRFDPERGASFATFAAYRIRGAILNGLTTMSEIRSQNSYRYRQHRDRVASLTERNTDGKQDLFDSMVELTIGLAIGFILEDTGLVSQAREEKDQPYTANQLTQLHDLLTNAIDHLPERDATIIRCHYLQGANFDLIADILGVTKGRVSQLHKRSLKRLRDFLGQGGSLDAIL